MPLSFDEPTQNVRKYTKRPVITVPETPDYIRDFMLHSASSGSSSQLSGSSSSVGGFSLTQGSHASSLGSPFEDNSASSARGFSAQPNVIQARQTEAQKLEVRFSRMEELLKSSGFSSLGELLQTLFYNPTRIPGQSDPRGKFHAKSVSRFLQGRNAIKMSDIITLIYNHKHSAPSPASLHYAERSAPYSPSVLPEDIFHARPSLFAWATNLVSCRVSKEISQLSETHRTSDNDSPHLLASTNGRQVSAKLVTWEALGEFSMSKLSEKYREQAPVSWHLTESMAAAKKNGVFIVKKRRPHPIIQTGAISSFILSRNRFANGDLAFRAALRDSWQYEKAETFIFDN